MRNLGNKFKEQNIKSPARNGDKLSHVARQDKVIQDRPRTSKRDARRPQKSEEISE